MSAVVKYEWTCPKCGHVRSASFLRAGAVVACTECQTVTEIKADAIVRTVTLGEEPAASAATAAKPAQTVTAVIDLDEAVDQASLVDSADDTQVALEALSSSWASMRQDAAAVAAEMAQTAAEELPVGTPLPDRTVRSEHLRQRRRQAGRRKLVIAMILLMILLLLAVGLYAALVYYLKHGPIVIERGPHPPSRTAPTGETPPH